MNPRMKYQMTAEEKEILARLFSIYAKYLKTEAFEDIQFLLSVIAKLHNEKLELGKPQYKRMRR